MAANEDPKDIDAADKAYQATTEAVPVKPVAPVEPVAPPVEAKAAPAVAPKAKKSVPIKPAVAARATKPKAVTIKAAPIKPAPIKPAPIKAAPIKAPKPKAAKTASNSKFAGLFSNFMLEDKTMDMNANFSGFQNVMTEAQAKAKAAFEKSTTVLGEAGDFAKGNVEAVMESGKILAEGIQGIGSELVAEGRSAFEAMTGDIKELAAAKSPNDFFKVQGEMMRKSFDSAVAYGSKNSEVMLKLMTDAMAPISGRVSIAMEKARSTSL